MIDFCIGGAPKCATTALFDYLSQHPDIVASDPKEPHYFASASLGRPVMQGDYTRSQYAEMFADTQRSQKKGEGSTHYLHLAEHVAPLMAKEAPQVRLVFCLRNPIARAWSHYLYRYTNAGPYVPGGVGSNDSFLEFALHDEIFAMGNYASNISKFKSHFPQHQIYLVFMEDIATNLAETLRGICRHVRVDPSFSFDLSDRSNETIYPKWPKVMPPLDTVVGKTYPHLPHSVRKNLLRVRERLLFNKQAPKPKLNSRDREVLAKAYRPSVEALEELTDRSLDSWKQ